MDPTMAVAELVSIVLQNWESRHSHDNHNESLKLLSEEALAASHYPVHVLAGRPSWEALWYNYDPYLINPLHTNKPFGEEWLMDRERKVPECVVPQVSSGSITAQFAGNAVSSHNFTQQASR